MDTYDDCCWYPEPSFLSAESASQQFSNDPYISPRLIQQQPNGLAQSHRFQQQLSQQHLNRQQQQHHHLHRHHQNQQQQLQQGHTSPRIVLNSALSSPSSGYCSSEDCSVGIPVFGGSSGGLYSPTCADGSTNQPLIDSANSLVEQLLLSTPSSSPLAGSGGTSPNSPTIGVLISTDPCLGQQLQQQQQQQHLGDKSAQTMNQEFIDDYGAAWSGAIGCEDLEAFWDPFGASAISAKLSRLSDWTVEGNAASSTASGAVESMDSSALFSQYIPGNMFTQSNSCGEDYNFAGFSTSSVSQTGDNNGSTQFGSGGRNSQQPSAVDVGFGLSTSGMAAGTLGETSMVDMLNRDAYLSSTSSARANGYGFGSMAVSTAIDFEVQSPTSAEVCSEAMTLTSSSVGSTVGQFHSSEASMSSFPQRESAGLAHHSFASSPALIRDAEMSSFSSSVAGYHLQHMAADMATGCDDTDDFELLPLHHTVDSSKKSIFSNGRGIVTRRIPDDAHEKMGLAELMSSSRERPNGGSNSKTNRGGGLFSGVFGQRNNVATTVRSCGTDSNKVSLVSSPFVGSTSRSRGITEAKSCGSLLQLAPPYGPSSRTTANCIGKSNSPLSFQQGSGAARNRPSNPAVYRSNANDMRTDTHFERSSSFTDGIGNAATGSNGAFYPSLDDHRYTSKALPSVQMRPPSKLQKTQRGGTRNNASNGRMASSTVGGSNNCTTAFGSRSILEAFLRSTRPMDPNKGSNAALAAEGLLHLHIGDRSPRKHRSSASSSSSDQEADDLETHEGTLLKKLLTGEIDQTDVQRGHNRDRSMTSRHRYANGKRSHPTSVETTASKQLSPQLLHPIRVEIVEESPSAMPLPVTTDSREEFSSSGISDCSDQLIAATDGRFNAGASDGNCGDQGANGLAIDMDLSVLDDPACMAIFGLIDDADVDDGVWMSATAAASASVGRYNLDEQLSPSELDEILREEIRHGDLWHQHYAVNDNVSSAAGVNGAVGAV